MFRKTVFAASAGLALIAQPIAAQDSLDDDPAMAAVLDMFKAEPLTAEEEARLPLAGEVVAQMIPEGTMGEMMGSLFDGMLKPIMDLAQEPSAETVAEQLGVEESTLALEGENVEEALSILDPVWSERAQIEADMMPKIMADLMNAMEPSMRRGMTEVYAVHFTNEELTDINAFFQTTSGANFARKSFTISSDPRLIGSMMEDMPTLMGAFETMGEQIATATADLPAARSFDEITIIQRTRLAELTGLSVEDLETAMAVRAAADDVEENMVEDSTVEADVVEDAT